MPISNWNVYLLFLEEEKVFFKIKNISLGTLMVQQTDQKSALIQVREKSLV